MTFSAALPRFLNPIRNADQMKKNIMRKLKKQKQKQKQMFIDSEMNKT